MDLQMSVRKSKQVTILDVEGRILIGPNNDAFGAELRRLAAAAPCNLLINLDKVRQMDSSSISTLVRSFVTLARDGGSLKILNPIGPVRTVLELTRLVNSIPTYRDEDTALASFHPTAAHA
jgi:anti-anti-sigma factor